MNGNHLLFWLSARREGSWMHFRAAVEELHFASQASEPGLDDNVQGTPLYQLLRFALERSGHVEFAGEELRWRVSPPVLAAKEQGGEWSAILCGARLPRLIEQATTVPGITRVEIQQQPPAPDVITLHASDKQSLEAIASRINAKVQVEAPLAILAAVPSVGEVLGEERQLPAGGGWKVSRFSPTHLAWTESSPEESAATNFGLFRFNYYHMQHHFLRRNRKSFVINGQVAKFIVLASRRRKGLLRYEISSHTLSIPAVCRPPMLIDRALVLCSGTLPKFNPADRTLAYSAVARDTAVFAGRLLKQEIR